MDKEELLMLTYGEYKPEDGAKTLHGQKEIILHIDRDPVNPEDGHCAYLVLEQTVWMTTHRGEQMDMHNAIEFCPEDARVFVAGLGVGLILLYLARAKKTREVVVAELNPHVIKIIAPRLSFWFSEHYPDFRWSVVQGDAMVEAGNHGKFDWMFWDIWPVASFKEKASDKFVEISKPHLTEEGIITTWHDLAKMRRDMKDGLGFKSYLNYTLVGNIHSKDLRIRADRNPVSPTIEKEFWDDRYKRGKTSGRGDDEVGEIHKALWKAIERELPEINHIIDVGCGDLKIWGDRDCDDYVGLDFAMEILQENKDRRRRHWAFYYTDAAEYIPGLIRENVFCFNMIYHVMSPKRLRRVLVNLCRYASENIFIYTWIENPFHPYVHDGKYQAYHAMGKYLELMSQNGFDLVSVEIIEDPVKLAEGQARLALYIYKKKGAPPERFLSV